MRARCQSASRCPSDHWGSVAHQISCAVPQVQSRQVSVWPMMHTVASRDDQNATSFATCLHDPGCHCEMCPMYSELPFDCLLPPTCQQYQQAAHQYCPPVTAITSPGQACIYANLLYITTPPASSLAPHFCLSWIQYHNTSLPSLGWNPSTLPTIYLNTYCSLRSTGKKRLKVPRINVKSFGYRSFSYKAPTVFNSLPSGLRVSFPFHPSIQTLKHTCFKNPSTRFPLI